MFQKTLIIINKSDTMTFYNWKYKMYAFSMEVKNIKQETTTSRLRPAESCHAP